MGHNCIATEARRPSKMKLLSVGFVLALLLQENYGIPVDPSLQSLQSAVETKLFDGLVNQVTDGYDKDSSEERERKEEKTFNLESQELLNILNNVKEYIVEEAYELEEGYRREIASNLIKKDRYGLAETLVRMAKKIIIIFNDEVIKRIVGNGDDDRDKWRNKMIKLSWKEGIDHDDSIEALIIFGVRYAIAMDGWVMYAVKGAVNEMVKSITNQAGKKGDGKYNTTKMIENIHECMSIGEELIHELEYKGLFFEFIHYEKSFLINELKRYMAAAKMRGWSRVTDVQKAHSKMVDYILEAIYYLE